jgi:hypothetical protein
MKRILSIFLLLFLLLSCKKNDNEVNNLLTTEGWSEIDFKGNYTIQIPRDFVGVGMSGFEGNTFFKSSSDNKIKLSYAYCNSLFCSDFGDSLKSSIPQNMNIVNNYSKSVTLDHMKCFRRNSDTIGILYYSTNDPVHGRLYWKDKDVFKQALELEFNIAKFDTVSTIIETIRSK